KAVTTGSARGKDTALSRLCEAKGVFYAALVAKRRQHPSALCHSKANADKLWLSSRTCEGHCCSRVAHFSFVPPLTAGDFAADALNFREPQQDLIDNLSEVLRETKEVQSCEKQQEELCSVSSLWVFLSTLRL